MDVGRNLVGFCAWFGTALPAILVGARLVGRFLDRERSVPAGAWLTGFLLWALLASVAGGIGQAWIGLAILPVLLWAGAKLATRDGWPSRPAWFWSIGTFAAFGVYALLGRLILTLGPPLTSWGWWVLIAPVWVAWLRMRTVAVRRPSPPVQ